MSGLGTIKYATIHCTATPEGRDDQPKKINDDDIRKFGTKSYHYIILLDGTLVNNKPLTEKGAHVGGHNTGNIGIAYIGGMTADMKKAKDTRTPRQKAAMKALVETLKKLYPNIEIKGHRDWSPDLDKDGVVESQEWTKQCPSFDVKSWIKAGMPT